MYILKSVGNAGMKYVVFFTTISKNIETLNFFACFI